MPAKSHTLVGIPAMTSAAQTHGDPTVVLGQAGAGPPAGTPPVANGTPLPGAIVVAPPSAQAADAQPRSRRNSEAPSVGPSASKSAGDTFDSSMTTGVHATSAMPHPGVR